MYKVIKKEGLTKMELIGKYKVLARLYILLNDVKLEDNIFKEKVLELFYMRYPNFKDEELKEFYGIPLDNGVTQEVRGYNHIELELPNFPYYDELLYLNMLCNKIMKTEWFPTMVGQIYFRVGYLNSVYKVIFLEHTYGSEQLVILQNTNNKSDIVHVKISEWWNGKLSGHDWCCNYEMMVSWNLSNVEKEFDSRKKRLVELQDAFREGELCDYNVSLETVPGTLLKYRNDDYIFGRLDSEPITKNISGNNYDLKIMVDGKDYDSSSWEIMY